MAKLSWMESLVEHTGAASDLKAGLTQSNWSMYVTTLPVSQVAKIEYTGGYMYTSSGVNPKWLTHGYMRA